MTHSIVCFTLFLMVFQLWQISNLDMKESEPGERVLFV